jgi:EAL domain-containing protein (putative c-di-GMP-specific phosphodiesterase class I)
MPLSTTTPHHHAEAIHRRRQKRELADAVRHGRLALHYQPRICLRSGVALGAEALARWPHRRRGLLPPGSFLPLAEEAGLTAELGAWALRTACTAATTWPGESGVSVNVAAAQLAGGHLPSQLATALESSGLPPERLTLEFGESVLADTGLDALLTLSALRDLGIGLAVDKFGHGPASLSLLRRLPLTTLKLDRALVRDAVDNPEDRAILHAITLTGHAIGLCVVADGVETEAQRSMLAELGCDAAQGFLLSAAVPGAEIGSFFKNGSKVFFL